MDKEIKSYKKLVSMEEELKDSVDYIQEYEDALDSDMCLYYIDLINKVEKMGIGYLGATNSNKNQKSALTSVRRVDKKVKDSYDIHLNGYFKGGLFKNKKDDKKLGQYNKRLLNIIAYITGNYLVNVGYFGVYTLGSTLEKALKEGKALQCKEFNKYFAISDLCVRKYNQYEGGFHHLHFDAGSSTAHRVLAAIINLNDVDEGGHTSFPVVGRSIKPEKGKMLIFPSSFTHLHYGRRALSSDRYVICVHISLKELYTMYNEKRFEIYNKEKRRK